MRATVSTPVTTAAGQTDQAANIMMAPAIVLNLAGVQFDPAQMDQLKKLARPPS